MNFLYFSTIRNGDNDRGECDSSSSGSEDDGDNDDNGDNGDSDDVIVGTVTEESREQMRQNKKIIIKK
jgi:hypothetical protein